MSLNKFFDENKGYDIGCDIGADEMKCNNITLSSINGVPYPPENQLNNLYEDYIPNCNVEGGSVGTIEPSTFKSTMVSQPTEFDKVSLLGFAVEWKDCQMVYTGAPDNYSSFQFNVEIPSGATYETLNGSGSCIVYDGQTFYNGSVVFSPSGISSNPLRVSCYVYGTNQSPVLATRRIFVSGYLQYNRTFTPNP